MKDIKLHGFWPSPFVHRVIWGLKLKAIKYNYFEEEFPNKSDLFVKYNPVHKKVPLLIHGGKPISESLAVLEYGRKVIVCCRKMCTQDPLLGFGLSPICYAFFGTVGDEQEKASEEAFQVLKTLEEKGLEDKPYFGGERIELVDLLFGGLAYWFEGMGQVVNLKIVKPSTLPHFHSWINIFKQVPTIKDNAPDEHKLLEHLKRVRETFLAPTDSHIHRDE